MRFICFVMDETSSTNEDGYVIRAFGSLVFKKCRWIIISIQLQFAVEQISLV